MPQRRRYTCVVCGRVFPEGQGIVIEREGILLTFHSKACAVKFFKLFVERMESKEFKRVARELLKELEEARKARQQSKVI